MAVIHIQGLHKSYGRRVALRGFDSTVNRGEIYGFLGPNGAGKTTTIKIIMGLLKPDRGTVRVNGMDVVREGYRVRKKIGYLPERVAFYEDMTVEENMDYLCKLKGCSTDRVIPLLEEFRIGAPPDTKVKSLSKGMVQRLGLAQTLIGDPDLLILDEPTSGLDPEMRRWVKNRIVSLRDEGKTIFLSSHVLSEVQAMCDRVGIISQGRMVQEDRVDALGHRLQIGHRLEISVSEPGRALGVVGDLDLVRDPRIEHGVLVLYCRGEDKMKIIKHLMDAGFDVGDFRHREPDLEEVFVRLTEGGI